MSKSIYEILADLETTTSVPGHGKEISHTIPAELFPDDKTFEDADLLLEWSDNSDFTHALLQKGIQKGLIEVRAAFKACKKDDDWSPEYGQNNVDEIKWSVVNRPNQGGSKAISAAKLQAGTDMAKAMSAAGIDNKIILASLVPVYGEQDAESIMNALTD